MPFGSRIATGILLILHLPHIAASKGATELLASEADAVVIAEVQTGQQRGHVLDFVLSIKRSIKGPIAPGTTVSISTTTRLSVNRRLQRRDGLWFLKKRGSGWELIPVSGGRADFESCFFPQSPAASPDAFSALMPPSPTVGDRLAVEIGSAIEKYTSPSDLPTLAWALIGIDESTVLPKLYQRFRQQTDPEIRFMGVFGEMGGQSSASALGEIAENLALIRKLRVRSLIDMAVCSCTDANPQSVHHLGSITRSGSELARCAAMALDFIHTREAVPYLGELLYSADPKIREYAMQGLSRFVENLPIQTSDSVARGQSLFSSGPTPYRTAETDRYSLSRRWLGSESESDYLAFWRSWWTNAQDGFARKGPG